MSISCRGYVSGGGVWTQPAAPFLLVRLEERARKCTWELGRIWLHSKGFVYENMFDEDKRLSRRDGGGSCSSRRVPENTRKLQHAASDRALVSRRRVAADWSISGPAPRFGSIGRGIGGSPSGDTSAHSGTGNSYWPILILRFIPGEMAWPVLE